MCTHLVALAVVFQAARPLAVAAFAVPPVRLALFAFADFWLESLGVPVETRLDGFETLRFVLQVVEAVVAVAAVAELAVCEAVAVPEGQRQNLRLAIAWRAVRVLGSRAVVLTASDTATWCSCTASWAWGLSLLSTCCEEIEDETKVNKEFTIRSSTQRLTTAEMFAELFLASRLC